MEGLAREAWNGEGGVGGGGSSLTGGEAGQSVSSSGLCWGASAGEAWKQEGENGKGSRQRESIANQDP